MQESMRQNLSWGVNWAQYIFQIVKHTDNERLAQWGGGDRFTLNFVLQGNALYKHPNGTTYRLQPGSIYHWFPDRDNTPPPTLCLDESSPSMTEFYLTPDVDTYPSLRQLGILQMEPVLEVGIVPAIYQGYLDLLDLCRNSHVVDNKRRINAAIVRLLSQIYELADKKPGMGYWDTLIHEACELLQKDLHAKIQIESIAKTLNVSYPSLRREFPKHTGCSMVQFRLQKRIEQACAYLIDGSVRETSERLGYSDPFTFSTQFKKVMGMSPAAFRKNPGKAKFPPR